MPMDQRYKFPLNVINGKKPPLGVLKVNWDAALNNSSHTIGVGVLVRDDQGLVVASLCATVPYISDSTIGAWKVVSLCYEQGSVPSFWKEML
ncbi:hypothetical protein SLA2020_425280 [Shorea laevis]